MSVPSSGSDTRERRLGPRDRLAFLLVWLPYLYAVRHFWMVADDAYISFRYSRNWGAGLGLVYNPGESPPTEGYSNFLMVAVGALVHRLGASIELWLPALCVAAGSALLWAAFRTMRTRLGVGLVPALLAAAMLGWSAPFAVWSTTGLEAMPFALFFFAAVDRLCLRSETVGSAAAGLVAGGLACLLALTRVEGIAWAALVFPALGALAWRDRPRAFARTLAAYLAVLLVAYGAYFAARWSYFGHPWPATVYAKVGFTLERALRGADYVTVQALTSPWLLLVVPGAAVAFRRDRRRLGTTLALLPLGIAAYTVLVGGDWMMFARFLLPALPFAALLTGWLLQDAGARLGAGAAAGLGAAAVALAVLPGFDLHLVPHDLRARFHFRLNSDTYRSEWAQWWFQRGNGIRWAVKGRALRALGPPGATLVMGSIGAAGYESDFRVLDRHGFVTPEVALREVDPARTALRSPGHDKVVSETWFVEHGYDPVYLRAKLHEARTAEELAAQVSRSNARLVRSGSSDRYAVDFHAVESPDSGWFLVVWRRIGEGEDAQRDLARRVARFTRSGQVSVLDVATPDPNGVAGLPAWLRPRFESTEFLGIDEDGTE